MDPSTHIRHATSADQPILIALLNELHAYHCALLPEVFQMPEEGAWGDEYVSEVLASREIAVFLAEVEGEAVGFVQVMVKGAHPWAGFIPKMTVSIDAMYVRDGYAGRGIGKALMEQAERRAVERGAEYVELSVWEANRDAVGFYERVGFEPVTRRMRKCLSTDSEVCE